MAEVEKGSFADIQARTGIMEGSSESFDDTDSEAEDKTNAEEKSAEEAENPKQDSEDKPKNEEEDKSGEEEKVTPPKTNKSERPLKAVFAQLGELREAIESIKGLMSSSEKKDATNTVDDAIKQLATKRNLDAEGLGEIVALVQSKILKDLESKGVLNKDLPKEVQEKLKVLDQIQKTENEKAEVAHFDKEWDSVLPSLQKQFPNATASMIAEAKAELFKIARTKLFHDKEIDYVVFKSQDKLSALLKVAKGKKGGEGDSKQIKEDSDKESSSEEDIDLDPENINPEKMKKYQEKSLRGK